MLRHKDARPTLRDSFSILCNRLDLPAGRPKKRRRCEELGSWGAAIAEEVTHAPLVDSKQRERSIKKALETLRAAMVEVRDSGPIVARMNDLILSRLGLKSAQSDTACWSYDVMHVALHAIVAQRACVNGAGFVLLNTNADDSPPSLRLREEFNKEKRMRVGVFHGPPCDFCAVACKKARKERVLFLRKRNQSLTLGKHLSQTLFCDRAGWKSVKRLNPKKLYELRHSESCGPLALKVADMMREMPLDALPANSSGLKTSLIRSN